MFFPLLLITLLAIYSGCSIFNFMIKATFRRKFKTTLFKENKENYHLNILKYFLFIDNNIKECTSITKESAECLRLFEKVKKEETLELTEMNTIEQIKKDLCKKINSKISFDFFMMFLNLIFFLCSIFILSL